MKCTGLNKEMLENHTLEKLTIEELENIFCCPPLDTATTVKVDGGAQVVGLSLYPVKGCSGMSVYSWPVSGCGLRLDRHWCLWSSRTNKHLNIVRTAQPLIIHPFLDLGPPQGRLILAAISMPRHNFVLPLPDDDFHLDPAAPRHTYNILKKKYENVLQDCGDPVSFWLNEALGTDDCRLFRQVKLQNDLSLASDSHVQLINLASLEDLAENVAEDQGHLSADMNDFCSRFRANIILHGIPAYEENKWINVKICDVQLEVVAPVERCPAININKDRLEYEENPYKYLLKYSKGKPQMGVHSMVRENAGQQVIHVGDKMKILSIK